MVDLQRTDSLWSLNPWGSPRGRGGSRPAPPRQNCHAPHSIRPGGSILPVSISSMRVRVDPSTSGNAARAPASGAGGGLGAAAVGGAGSRAAPTAPGEIPSLALPGAAPSCGPAVAETSGRDWKSPESVPAVESMMMMLSGTHRDESAPLCLISARAALRYGACGSARREGRRRPRLAGLPATGPGVMVAPARRGARWSVGIPLRIPRQRRSRGPTRGPAASCGCTTADQSQQNYRAAGRGVGLSQKGPW